MNRLSAALLSLTLAASLSGAAPSGGAPSSRSPSPDGGPSARQTTPLSPTTLASPICYELRGPTRAHAALSQIAPVFCNAFFDTPLARLASSLDLSAFTFDDQDGSPFVFANDTATIAVLDSALSENGWHVREFSVPEEWPSSTRLYVQDADTATNHPILLIPHDRHILLTDTPVIARIPGFLNALSSLPNRLPAEGDTVAQITGDNLVTLAGDTPFSDFARHNIATLTAGLGLDGDTAALQLVLSPIPCSGLDDGIAACGPLSPSTACVNLPGAIAFAARAPGPLLIPHEQNQLGELLCLFAATRSVAASIFPPVRPIGLPRMLGFLETRPGKDDPAETREGFLSIFSTNVFAIDTTTYRGFPLDSISVADPDAFAAILDNRLGSDGATAHAIVAQGIASGYMTLSTASFPTGHLVALNDSDGTLLRAAIDAALDGDLSTRPFDQSPAFRAAFPHPDAPAHFIAHLDLSDFAAIQRAIGLDFIPILGIPLSTIPTPCPIDLFAYIASDSSLVLRLRAPAALLKSLQDAPAAPAPAGVPPAASAAAPSENAPSEGAPSSRARGAGACPLPLS